ncbi:MAG: hypothetical protein JW778_01995 [Candidatus Altiarchaeota archaeon]|nr:hypothetical protein [Candidatus Altiarchaeota archaeon]
MQHKTELPKLGKEHLILLMLVLLNVAIRLPVVPHEVGSDSFVYHDMAKSIIDDKQVKWTFYFWELFSKDSSSLPVISSLNLAILSKVTRLDIEGIILIFSVFLGIVGTLSAYLMAKELTKNTKIRLLITFLFSLSPIYLSITMFTVSTRGLNMAILPLLIWCLLRLQNTKRSIYIVLTTFLFMLFIPIHHSFVLVYSIIMAFIAAHFYFKVVDRTKSLKKRFHLHLPVALFLILIVVTIVSAFVLNYFLHMFSLNILLFITLLFVFYVTYAFNENIHYLSNRTQRILDFLYLFLPLILVVMLLSLILVQFFSGLAFFEKLRGGYEQGLFFEGSSSYIIFLNMCIDYGSSEGILSPFAIIGFLTMLASVNKNKNYLFLFLALISSSFLLVYGEYMTIFLLPLFSILTGYGLMAFASKLRKHRKLITSFFIVCVAISLVFSNFMLYHWVLSKRDRAGNTGWLQERTIHVSYFLDKMNGYGTSILTNDALFARQTKTILQNTEIGGMYELTNQPYESQRMLNLISDDKLRYFMKNENIPQETTGAERLYPSPFIMRIDRNEDKIYDNGFQGIWDLYRLMES